MTIAIARQPILDRQRELLGYELLFRDGVESALVDLKDISGNQATEQVISNSLLMFGIDALTGGSRAFINVTHDILVEGHVRLLPPERVIPEILESVPADARAVRACRELRAAGFRIALDDVGDEDRGALLDVVDIIKVDFQQTGRVRQKELVERFAGNGKKVLAEKVEDYEQYARAMEMGYDYFQGYFFARPETMSHTRIPASRLHFLELLSEINRSPMNVDALTDIIKKDISLTYRLLRYLNSASFAFRSEIGSVRHALTMLGEREIHKWGTLVAMATVGDGKPSELLIVALTRARFLELVAPMVSLGEEDQDLFLLGMLSLLDAVLDQPLARCLNGIPLKAPLRDGLLGRPGSYGRLLELGICYEKGAWSGLSHLARELSLSPVALPEAYLRASRWARRTFQAVTAPAASMG
ncbi:EAL domain-containing protein [bacterium]|nr:EAL domain-containing protein [bacterium]